MKAGRKPTCECGACSTCKERAYSRQHYQRNREAVKARAAEYRARMVAEGKAQAQRREWKRNHRRAVAAREGRVLRVPAAAMCDAHVRAWRAWTEKQRRSMECALTRPHDAHVKRWKDARAADYFNHRYRTDPEFNLKERIRARLRKVTVLDGHMAACVANDIKRGVSRREWEDLLGYTIPQLVRHLTRTLPPGTTWDDFLSGALHIDHILPRCRFDLTRIEEVRACWRLSNLRLLGAEENRRKGAKVEVLL